MKKTKKSKMYKKKKDNGQTFLSKRTLMIMGLLVFICTLGLMFGILKEQNEAHNYCVAYNAQVEISNLAMDKLTIYTNKQYPTQHAIDCPKAVNGLEWIN